MFVFYFGILADLTPPTAISTYATSSIAGADVWRTQWLAMMLALSGFIIPFSFAYDPALLLIGAGPLHIMWRTAAVTLGILMLGAGLVGYLLAPVRWWERALLLGGAALLIFPGAWSDALGVACFVAVALSDPTPSPVAAPRPPGAGGRRRRGDRPVPAAARSALARRPGAGGRAVESRGSRRARRRRQDEAPVRRFVVELYLADHPV